ncbi:hypothetical protein [Nocardia sp. NPDC050710]|uniref:hypothetical protein n=1 Tax=Nocardia sp. NPDC050710 TaxID=3157220 RepID=UPI0033C95A98
MAQHRAGSGPPGRMTVDYSHLFPGVIVGVDDSADEYQVLFADGSITDAAVAHDARGQQVLEVAGYTTSAGTVVPERIWTVRSVADGPGGLHIEIGPALY